MFDPKDIEEATYAMIGNNSDWREILEYAPGGAAIRIALAFYASRNLSDWGNTAKDRSKGDEERKAAQQKLDEYREFREALERQLTAAELKYLYESFRRMGVEAASSHYQELLQAKPQEEQTQAEAEYQKIAQEIESDRGGERDAWMSENNGGKPEEPKAEENPQPPQKQKEEVQSEGKEEESPKSGNKQDKKEEE